MLRELNNEFKCRIGDSIKGYENIAGALTILYKDKYRHYREYILYLHFGKITDKQRYNCNKKRYSETIKYLEKYPFMKRKIIVI